jgi:nicotinamide-nucleotide amidase
MRAYILSIGSELLLGQLTDTNATYLAQELSAVGINLIHVTHVGDDHQQLADAIRHALSLADFVICTGGVGPTDDDLTREAIADVVGETPAIDPGLLTTLKAFFRGRGQDMPERNAKQAWVIPSATILPNPVGTAPGWFVETNVDGAKVIVAMPGVPREMFRMWREQALPRLQERAGQHVIDSIIVKTIGIGESAAEDILHDLVLRADPVVATYAKDDGVHVRITAVGNDIAETRARRDSGLAEVRQRLDKHIWGVDFDTLPGVVATLLRAQGLKLGVVEHGTGGAFSHLLGSDLATSDAVAGSLVKPFVADSAEDGQTLAIELAHQACDLDCASFGVALVFSGSLQDLGLVAGQLNIAVQRVGSEPTLLAPATLRSTLAEVQRRAALHAADTLRQYLNS